MKWKFVTSSADPADDFKILSYKETERPAPVATATVLYIPTNTTLERVDIHQNEHSQWAMPAAKAYAGWDGTIHYRSQGFATPADKDWFFRGVLGALFRDFREAFE